MKFGPFVALLDFMSFYPFRVFDRLSFDPMAFDPMSVNHTTSIFSYRKITRRVWLSLPIFHIRDS